MANRKFQITNGACIIFLFGFAVLDFFSEIEYTEEEKVFFKETL